MTETEQLLMNKYGTLALTINQVATELHRLGKDGKPAYKSVLNDISANRFPIPTYKNGKSRLVDLRDLAAYLDRVRQEGKDKHEQEKAA